MEEKERAQGLARLRASLNEAEQKIFDEAARLDGLLKVNEKAQRNLYISVKKRRRLEREAKGILRKRVMLQNSCSHRVSDKTAGGAILCSICDKLLELE